MLRIPGDAVNNEKNYFQCDRFFEQLHSISEFWINRCNIGIVAVLFNMSTILWIANKTLSVGVIAAIVIFQPELRRALEQIGRREFLNNFFDVKNVEKFSDENINEITRAAYEMGKHKTGALIVIENEVKLGEYERTGIYLDAEISSQLLINIFEHNTPLHDGAVIIKGDRICSATCYLPLSDNMEISKELGTRHRAAVGISEVSDSLTIVVSEETGTVSYAREGRIVRDVKEDELIAELKRIQNSDIEVDGVNATGKEG